MTGTHAHEFLGLRGRTALVTGGSRGVGRATALLLARAGVDVGISYRSRSDEAEQVVREVTAFGVRGFAHGGDLTRPDVVAAFFDEGIARFGGIDFVIGNHGIWPPEDVSIAEMSAARWRRTLDVNLDSIFHLCQAAARHLEDDGRLVLVSSTAGQRGEAFHGDYAASKGAMISLVKGLCVELAPRGITVNSVAPGWIDTEMAHPAFEGEARDRIARSIPIGRIATAEDVAGPIAFLCSRWGRHVTGEILNVNGGAVLVG
ncbi:MAG: SDR family oxidoreductase [Gemmatimonadetes bacterium]|nr:SDR family oxidoreductase [Gemmatimonadota bacterium]NNK64164.1 SDR family oxidoreductase [Gemmatimonadota bacterium]